jgi:hypothetical protein
MGARYLLSNIGNNRVVPFCYFNRHFKKSVAAMYRMLRDCRKQEVGLQEKTKK